jgi:hypothetical protein
MPDDYCYHCHKQILTDRPSHQGFAFNSCASAGCHNYHDNTALYESFLLKNAGQPDLKDSGSVPKRDLRAILVHSTVMARREALAFAQQNAPASVQPGSQLLHDWAGTAHAKAGVNCTDCHEIEDQQAGGKRWSNDLDHSACLRCHAEEVGGFLGGKHGMRLTRGLTPMTPAQARLPMRSDAAHRELSCTSCHGAHDFSTRHASVDACLSCHNDSHSLAYTGSPHFKLWQAELNGTAAEGQGVTCATCHLPRELHGAGDHAEVRVQHNQNNNLRPNEKMVRTVCLNCHGLGFSLDALADSALVQTNFIGRPRRHIESIDLAVRRQMELDQAKSQPESKP